jgi:hypothetical protein
MFDMLKVPVPYTHIPIFNSIKNHKQYISIMFFPCICSSIVSASGLDIGQQVSDTLGYCAKSKRVFPGLLAEATTPIIQEELVKTLMAHGIGKERATKIIQKSWFEGDTGNVCHVLTFFYFV